jgi:hypothetical protein
MGIEEGYVSGTGPRDVDTLRRLKVTHRITPQVTTLANVLDWATEQGLDPATVVITGGHVTYTRDETQDERTARMEAYARGIERTRTAIRERYAELFGDLRPSEIAP